MDETQQQDASTPNVMPESFYPKARRQVDDVIFQKEIFDHLLYYLYHDCHVYACATKGSAFYESLEGHSLLGIDHEATLELVAQQAELLADFIQDIQFEDAFPHGVPRSA